MKYAINKLPLAVKDALNAQKKPHKYGAKACECLYKHKHDSQKEAMWCVKLHQEQQEGKIRNLLMQTEYDLRVNGVLVCKHILDFDYERYYPINTNLCADNRICGWTPEVVDVKGMKLPVWSLKHKLFMAIYTGIKYEVV